MAAQVNGRNGAETLLYGVTVVLNISACLSQVRSFKGKGSKYKLYFAREMAE